MPNRSRSRTEDWPSLPPAAWGETRATLHMWTQIIGKIRDLDFIEHSLHISVDDARREGFALGPRSVTDLHTELLS